MTSIHLKISGANAVAETSGILTAGMVGVPVTIEYDSSWDGLIKTFVCRCGSVTKSRIGIESSTTLPHEAMVTGCDLYIGVCGRSPDGTTVVPSIWARCGRVYPSAAGNAEESSDPENPIWAQIQGQIGALDNLETAAKENLVSAINELHDGKQPTGDYLTAGHNISPEAHEDIRNLIAVLTDRLNAIADSDDNSLDQLSEIVAYIKSNKSLIEQVTTNKVNVSDIVNNLMTNEPNKPLSASMGVALKRLIDAIVVPTALSQLAQDSEHRTVSDAEKDNWSKQQAQAGLHASDAHKAAASAIEAAKESEIKAVEAAESVSNAQRYATAASEAATTATEKATEATKSAESATASARNAESAAQEAITAAGSAAETVGKHNESQDAHFEMRKMLIDQLAPEFHEKAPLVQGSLVEGYPMQVVSHIMPIQEGEGDPSPENVRPIKGWDKAKLTVCGENLITFDKFVKAFGTGTSSVDGNHIVASGMIANNKYPELTNKISVGFKTKGRTFYLNISSAQSVKVTFYFRGGQGTAQQGIAVEKGQTKGQGTLQDDYKTFDVIAVLDGDQQVDVDFSFSVSLSPVSGVEPYNGEGFTTTFPETVFGGELDWDSGVVTLEYERAEIDSMYLGFNQNPQLARLRSPAPVSLTATECGYSNILKRFTGKTAYAGTEQGVYKSDSTTYFIDILLLVGNLVPHGAVPGNRDTYLQAAKSYLNDNQAVLIGYAPGRKLQVSPVNVVSKDGITTAYSNTGDTTVVAREDPVYINKTLQDRIAALEKAIIGG